MRAFSTISSLLVLAAVALTSALPTFLDARDVVAPPITYPTTGTVWTVGAKEHVDWDTSKLPPYQNITNREGRVVLGYIDECDPDSGLHLQLDKPLASGFNITLGTIPITVPDVAPRRDYIIVLFGDSGNTSPTFTISGIAVSGSSAAAPSSSCSTSSGTTASSTAVSSSTGSSVPSTSTSGSTDSVSSAPVSSSAVTTLTTETATSVIVVVPSSRSSALTSSATSAAASASASSSNAAATSQSSNNGALSGHPVSIILGATCLAIFMSTFVI